MRNGSAELKEALALAEGHLSLYQLTIEPDTPFAALHATGKLVVPDADAAHALYESTQELTAAAGLPAYEISNHATPGEESRHNLLYWRYGEYVGLRSGRARTARALTARATPPAPSAGQSAGRSLSSAKATGCVEAMPLTPAEEADERLLMGLRLTEGVTFEGGRGAGVRGGNRRAVGSWASSRSSRLAPASGASAQHPKAVSS